MRILLRTLLSPLFDTLPSRLLMKVEPFPQARTRKNYGRNYCHIFRLECFHFRSSLIFAGKAGSLTLD